MATARWGDRSLWPPAPGAPTTEVFIVSHGYHAGIVVPRAALAGQAKRRGLSALGDLATRFAGLTDLKSAGATRVSIARSRRLTR